MKTKIYSEYFMDKERVIQYILDWKVIASIVSVSSSWMSRKIKFAVCQDDRLINITREIFFLYNNYFDFDTFNWYVTVKGCGMDMIFHTLYKALGYEVAKNRNQRYFTF